MRSVSVQPPDPAQLQASIEALAALGVVVELTEVDIPLRGYRGLPEEAPFDGVIVTAAPPYIPQPLVDQLKVGGRMVIPVGVGYQELQLLEKTETGIEVKRVIAVSFVPMTGEVQRKKGKTGKRN